jgi:hypothetical protein
MLENHSTQLRKILKLFAIIVSSYLALTKIPSNKLNKNEIYKIIAIIGIVYLILDSYYPVVDYD